jgi:hypothetical protein
MGKQGKDLDFNFYPEREEEAHWTLMEICLTADGDYPANIPLAKLIRLIVDTKLLLWETLYEIDAETGEIHARHADQGVIPMIGKAAYVLYIEHDDRPHDVSVYDTLSEAKASLQSFAQAVFDGEDKNMPNDQNRILEQLAECREFPRIYACYGLDSVEVTRV